MNLTLAQKKWISDDVLYAPKNEGGFNMININNFFHALQINWIRRYIKGLDDHWLICLMKICAVIKTQG